MSLTTLRAFLSSPWKRKDTLCEHSREADYSPLLRDDEIQTSSESEILSTRPEGQKDSVPRSKSFCNPLFVFNVILTVFNCALAFSVWHYTRNLPLQTSFYPVHRLSHGDIARLRRPSQFINLEKMYTSIRPQPRTFKNWPLILAPIDPDHPDKAFSHDPKRHMTIVGSISPEDRQFHVTSKVESIPR
ncbi:hypothetical protein P691DRAFT_253988 [Macrolepiota fuliginosa MF-IS2]|uniref:Uncharacterized protein n=1 Tax=Macrolepiota fuliginosa MF-IS2 TaxID=1400762 RepID=A0A9P5X9A4_9AGAR|nr:hypothetical protein P691DRAFT_253988 [Macrolepiota fuliginosa MF-IS2]